MAGSPKVDRPLHALLCPVGSTGDLHPLLAVGAAMRARGHRVTVIGGEPFASAVAQAGFEFVAVQSAEVERTALAHKDAWSYADGYRVHMPFRCLEPLRRTHQAIVERYEPGRTVVAALNWCLAARVAQESHGVPMATLHLNAFTLRSARGILKMPAPMLVGPWLFPWYVRWEFRVLDALFVDPLCRPTLNAFRGELGLPPVRRIMDAWCNSPDAVVGMFPEWWCPPQPEWPAATKLVGFPVYDGAERQPLANGTAEFLQAGEKPIVFTPGASGMHTRAYFSAAVEAARRLRRRALVITPRSDLVSSHHGPDVHVCRYAPFRLVLPHAAAVVHQAGIGTTSQCLRAGVPQVCVPSIYNQPDTAERLRRLGVARTLAPKHFTVDRLHQALTQMLDHDETSRRCTEIAQRFGPPEAAAERTADVLEQLARP